MPRSARLCVHCGYDRQTRERAVLRPEPPPAEGTTATPSPWTGPTATALAILAVFGAAAPLAWRHTTATLVYVGAAVLLFVPLWFVQRRRAVGSMVDPDEEIPDDDPALRAALGGLDLLGGEDETDRRARRIRSAIFDAMFSRQTAGRVQSALLASMLALLAGFYLLVGAFRTPGG